ncbi:hypothetical protein [Streptomyces misionensis]|uniref:hypothetical protein n=1 Tax=Streptomyces misionensis TaxID=67331 RepID=UPI00396BE317
MSSNTAPTTTAPRPANTERRIAYATTLAPITAGILAPLLNHDTAIALDLAYLPAAAFTTASAMDWIPHTTYQQLPAGDILHRHRFPAFLSTLATGVALGMGTFTGSQGADALLAGILDPLTTKGIVSLGWWATVALVPTKLRRILTSRKPRTARPTTTSAAIPAKPTTPPTPQTPEQQILHAWGQHISHPDTGSHRGQTLRLRTINAYRWQGTITAPIGTTVTVTKDAVSSVYRKPAEWIDIKTGAHAGEATITVNLQPPAELDTSTLAGAWRKWAARNGGVMAGTHLEEVQPDPNTGGEVARVIADDTLDALPTPNMRDLVGALRTNHLLLSYEPSTNPRTAVIRLMKENPLRAGTPFPGPKTLLPSEGGYFRIGRAVSGRPLRAQLLDPKLGARHLFVSGVTGSGKGGVLQLIALAAHLAGAVIIYADPKGSSNPAIEKMAAYTGLGEDGAMGALLLTEALVNHRINLTGQIKQKNFNPDVMPHVVFILDEASTLLGEKATHRKRATAAVGHIAKKGRSLGVSEVLANQLLQLAEIGGDSAIRDNIIGSGGVIMLRSDSSQRHLIDLPPGMQTINPADIPATWTGDDNGTLVYTDDIHIQDPESTFGLGYFMTTDGVCAMGRTYTLEDATEHIDENNVTEPFDWPDWDNRHNLVAALLAEDNEDLDSTTSTLFTGAEATPKKPASAKDKILNTLQDLADPLGIDTNYTHKDDIGRIAGVEGQTLANTLSQLVKTNEIHRGPDAGTYGLGPAPTTE